MASALKNLSDYKPSNVDISDKKFTIVVSSYYEEITGALCEGAYETLVKEGASEENITIQTAPGTFELPLAAQLIASQTPADAIICIGCVVQGETKHFDFICQSVADGITKVGLDYSKPVIFGVLTPNTYEQAKDRAGGKHGNKGVEAANAAIQMVGLKSSLNQGASIKF